MSVIGKYGGTWVSCDDCEGSGEIMGMEAMWQRLEDAEKRARKMQNQALSADWYKAEFDLEFGRKARSAIATQIAGIRATINALEAK